MNQNFLLETTNQALILVLILSMPPIIVATVVGVLVSLIQALTQVQEQTLGFAVKLIVVTVVLLLTAGWTGAEMFKFTLHIFDTFPTLRR
ncbi:SctS family type III secretion system export apparatus subunit PscS [Prosthecobacter algae]|uniref:SctS family type III secretion system export apparatus subunit PscS n=1 Tax=Prosthecobacter algae TaxID=1144682 RepID=A0ABP9PPF2_9BACT